jgi:hypothetical protein
MKSWSHYYNVFGEILDKVHYLRIALVDESTGFSSASIEWLEKNGYTETGAECSDIFQAKIGEYAPSTEEISDSDGEVVVVDSVDIFHKPPLGWHEDDSWFEDASNNYRRRTEFIEKWFGIPKELILEIVIGECDDRE